MATFEDFLNEKNITLKRRYTENYPAKTVSGSARVRNSIIKALKNNKIKLEEFNELVNKNTIDSKRWSDRNKRFFKIEEDGVSLSKYGTKILNSLVTESINEKVNVGRYQREGKLGYNDQFHGRHSLSFTLGVDLGLDPDNEFGGGDWPGFDHKSLYVNGGKKEGTVLADALSGKYTYDDLKSALAKFLGITESNEVTEGLNKSDVAYQLAIDYTGRTKPKITKLNKKRIQIKYGYKISPEKVIDSIKKVHPEVELKHVEWSDKMSGEGFHIFDILESAITEARYDKKKLLKRISDVTDALIQTKDGKEYTIFNPEDFDTPWNDKTVFATDDEGEEHEIDYTDIKTVMVESVNEARVSAKKLLKSVVNGETNSVEGVKLSKDMAQSFLDWLDQSSYGRKFSELPFDKLFTASFNWGIERYAKGGKLKNELKDLKIKAKAMKESKIYESFNGFITEGKESWVVYDTKTKKRLPNAGKVYKDYKAAELFAAKQKNAAVASETFYFDKIKEANAMDDFEQGGEDYLAANEASPEYANKEAYNFKVGDIVGNTIDGFEFEVLKFVGGGKILVKNIRTKRKFKAYKQNFYLPSSTYEHESSNIEEKMIYTKFSEFVNESLEINEALKSSKLRGLLTMKRGTKNLLKAIYGFSKIALDKITDDQIIDIDPREGKKAEGLVVYYTTQEKDNPYADTSKSYSNATGKIPANTILALGMGKDYTFIKRDYIKRKMQISLTTDPKRSSHDIGLNKDYRGWDASGLGSLARIIDVADAAFVINPNALPSTRGKIEDRIKAKEGAVAFKSDKEFKDANMARYREILQKRASELPIDKLVMDAIDDATKVMKDGLKNQEKNKYGELIAGVGADGRAYKLNDISNFINGLISAYERWSGYIAEVDEAEKKYGKDSKEYKWQARYAEKESKEYAKSIKDKLAKLKKRNLAW